MPDARAPVASALPPAIPCDPLVIRRDLEEATENLIAEIDNLRGDGRNRGDVIPRIRNEIQWMLELIEELESVTL